MDAGAETLVVRLHPAGERCPYLPGEWIVDREWFVRPLEHDHPLLPGQSLHHCGLRERAEDVDVNRPDLGIVIGTQVVDRGFDVLGRRAQRDEHHIGVFGGVLRDESVVPAGEHSELVVGVLKEAEDRLVEVVAACDHAVHVVLLVLDGTEEHRVLEIDHGRHPATGGTEEHALGLGRTLDDVVGSAQKLTQQIGLGLVEGPLEVGGEEAVLHVHPGVQGLLGDLAQDDRLIGGLLGVLGEQDDPTRVERRVDVVVATVDVERVFRERSCRHLDDHGRELARRVVVLLDAVDDALTGGEVDDPVTCDRQGDGAALCGMFAFGFDGDPRVPEDVQLALGERLLVQLAHFRRRRDRVEHPSLGDPRLRVIRHELVAVRRDPDPRKARWCHRRSLFSTEAGRPATPTLSTVPAPRDKNR